MKLVRCIQRDVHDAPVIDGWAHSGFIEALGFTFEWDWSRRVHGTRVRDLGGELPHLVLPIGLPDPSTVFGRAERNGLDEGITTSWNGVELRLEQDGSGWSRSARAVRCHIGHDQIAVRVGFPAQVLFDEVGVGRLAELRRTTLWMRQDADKVQVAVVTMLLAINVADRVRIQWPF